MWVNYLETQQQKEEITDKGGTHGIHKDVAEPGKCNFRSFINLKPQRPFDFPIFHGPHKPLSFADGVNTVRIKL